jgi:hypothetical protein
VGDTAALVYVGRGWREAGAAPFVAAMTSVYVRIGGEWKLALYQQTPRHHPRLTPPPDASG